MKTLPLLPSNPTPSDLFRADEFVLLHLHEKAVADHDEALDHIIQAEVHRRIKFDLIDSVVVYNAFSQVRAYRKSA